MRTAAVIALFISACAPSAPSPDVTSGDALLTTDATQDTSPALDADAPDTARADAGIFTPPVELGRHAVTVSGTRRIVPSAGLPAEAMTNHSNNNLDVARHGGRVYLAWRTAPDHFASADARINVVSSTDESTWRFESTFTAGHDLREPRFLSLGASLFLYIARLGTNPVSFEPAGTSVAERRADGTWSTLDPIFRAGFIGWRARTERATPYIIGYFGGEHIYRFDDIPLDVELLTTTDGRTLTPVDTAMPAVTHGGGSETDFTMNPDTGELFAVQRNEAGDETGFGSKVCHAPAGSPARWTCANDPRKYDSPYVFWHDGEVYMIGRRNLSPTGNYDLMIRGDRTMQAIRYQSDYTRWQKRCSLWRYVQGENRIAYVLDLPSRGDTCFPSVLPLSGGEFAVYDYSSDVEGPDIGWREGQMGSTFVYRHVLRFTAR